MNTCLRSILVAAICLTVCCLAGAPRVAFASGGQCPVDFDSSDCSPGALGDICTETSSTYTCDVSAAGIQGAKVTVVTNFDDGQLFEAWGVINGNTFCCASTGTWAGGSVIILGSDYGDELRFSDLDDHYLEYNPEANYYVTLAEIQGEGQNDFIVGTVETHPSLIEELYGGDGNDSIHGLDGDDYISGGIGNDFLSGGPGGDTMTGGAGNDIMKGDAGDDTMDGDAGVDRMSGDEGDDIMDGGSGGDIMCGGGEDDGDRLYDGDSDDEGTYPDIIWSAIEDDDITCGHMSTLWDCQAIEVGLSNCMIGEDCLTTKPSLCP